MQKTSTKGELALFALRKCAVASNATLTDVEPQSVADALYDLEVMMAEWRAHGIDISYRFAEDGQAVSPDDPTGVLPIFTSAVGYQLMLRILADYGIEPTPRQEATAQTAYDALLTATLTVPSLKRRGDMPTGQGNQYDHFITGRYYPDKRENVNGDNAITPDKRSR
ncbi:packaged DNA stabilization gp4 family protein [Sodalis sp. (in: enterobacteria)]|uniref:packaged DNA stabilization gp4 family protein n=1 Tax=Sodalis sp. (in: enterobacteria) TaxID=1898979 RepID=UPI003F3BE8D7